MIASCRGAWLLPKVFGVAAFASISIASAQTQPSPPTDLRIDGGTSVPSPSPAGLLFFDDFNYVVDKFDSRETKIARFTSAGWDAVKDEQVQPGRALGYISTVASIPGYAGQMPGLSGSGRVLRLEGLPSTLGDFSGPRGTWRAQTDFYLSYGHPHVLQPSLPGNVWFQFWVYVNDYGAERSHWSGRNKWIYPSNDGSGGGDGTANAYMISIRPTSQTGVTQSYSARSYIVSRITAGFDGIAQSNSPDGPQYVGTNLAPDGFTPPNGWYLYKIHIDHASEHGRYEVWRRAMGGNWLKTSEWISGVTPGFTWLTQPHQRVGHNMFKFPTTWGTHSGDDDTNYDSWVYVADFAIATRETDLPTYVGY